MNYFLLYAFYIFYSFYYEHWLLLKSRNPPNIKRTTDCKTKVQHKIRQILEKLFGRESVLPNECEIWIHILWKRNKSDGMEAKDVEVLVRLWKRKTGQRSFERFFQSLKGLKGSSIQIKNFLYRSSTFLLQKSTQKN